MFCFYLISKFFFLLKVIFFHYRLVALEEQYKKEKEEADQLFAEERKNYEAKIESLQKQVEEQSMISSMYSSCTVDDIPLHMVEEENMIGMICSK